MIANSVIIRTSPKLQSVDIEFKASNLFSCRCS